MKYIDLTEVRQQEFLMQANIATRIQKKNIEKDWWVTQVLKAIFALPYAEHTRRCASALAQGLREYAGLDDLWQVCFV